MLLLLFAKRLVGPKFPNLSEDKVKTIFSLNFTHVNCSNKLQSLFSFPTYENYQWYLTYSLFFPSINASSNNSITHWSWFCVSRSAFLKCVSEVRFFVCVFLVRFLCRTWWRCFQGLRQKPLLSAEGQYRLMFRQLDTQTRIMDIPKPNHQSIWLITDIQCSNSRDKSK